MNMIGSREFMESYNIMKNDLYVNFVIVPKGFIIFLFYLIVFLFITCFLYNLITYSVISPKVFIIIYSYHILWYWGGVNLP